MTSHNEPLNSQLRGNLEAVQERIATACSRANRSPDSVQLVAVTKYTQTDVVEAFHSLTPLPLGESRPQQLCERANSLSSKIRWHLIGHLQTNKVRSVLPYVELIHSVDSLKLAERIDRIGGELQLRPRILCEVNTSGEAAKDGFSSEEFLAGYESLLALKHVQVEGLMTMAPHTADGSLIRHTFRSLKELADRVEWPDNTNAHYGPQLSMGMSHDFEIAIEEGATLIRLGSILFAGT